MSYFPFLRGKQNELLAVRELASSITRNGRVIPIIEPVNANSSTRLSLDRFIEESMPFLFICNPIHGRFNADHVGLRSSLIGQVLIDYDNWTPSLYVRDQTSVQELELFIETYSDEHHLALIYYGRPQRNAVRRMIEECSFRWHVFIDKRVEREYIQSVSTHHRVQIYDPFVRRSRNADYPEREFFTDCNTVSGNPNRLDFGDFSIVGDHYTETGGPAYAVALHHVHYAENSRTLHLSHFISDRIHTPVDTPGKIIEAVKHLVESFDIFKPNDTQACQEYCLMNQSEQSRGLGYMKRLAIKHHLEIMLRDGLDR